MALFESGVSRYVTGTATVQVYFPVDDHGREHVRCEMCPYYHKYDRKCGLNGEMVAFPEKYIGSRCPLEFEEV